MMIHSYNNKGGPDGGSSLSVFIGISLGISFLLLFLIILIVLGITLKKKQGENFNLYWLCIHASYEAMQSLLHKFNIIGVKSKPLRFVD